MPDNILRVHREKGTSFYCPNGHSQCFTTTEVDRLRQQLRAVRDERDWAQKGRDRAQRQTAAQKGNVTKLKRRIKNGVCPCCNRSFENLARHMAGQHPDFVPEKTDGDAQVMG